LRYAIISDIHANLEAFEAILEDAQDIDGIWCMGDVVGYGPNPNECINLLRSYSHLCVAGNHDLAAVGQVSTDTFNEDAKAAIRWTAAQLTPETMEYLQYLPLIGKGHPRFSIVHGSPRDPIWEYLLYDDEAAAAFRMLETDCCFVGHTHVPIVFRELKQPLKVKDAIPAPDEAIETYNRRLIINPGAVGQPRDGDPRGSYILLDTEGGIANYRRVPYPIEKVQEKMRLARLPQRLIDRLAYGR
jgi:diadenosine tetraphosphatase ApaH/serine/threonine PP2A family protein phosphatase